jgi:hypothetical protein
MIAQWLPLTLRLTNMQVLYSTNAHGRSLDMLYQRVKHARHSLLLCEVFPSHVSSDNVSSKSQASGSSSNQNNCESAADSSPSERVVVGMYASHAWRASTQVYGDGECFLFRLQPNPKCFKWTPRALPEHHSDNQTALLEQFMVGTRSFISMGGNPDGSSGLRLNEDLTVGESSPAVGFDNEPLHGENQGSVFSVGLVEVYGFVRHIDGKSV